MDAREVTSRAKEDIELHGRVFITISISVFGAPMVEKVARCVPFGALRPSTIL